MNSRPQKRSNQVWRRRRCDSCSHVFTTSEAIDLASSMSLKASNGTLLPFIRDLHYVSVLDSLRHRKTAIEDASALSSTVTSQLNKCLNKDGTINRDLLVEMTLLTLQRFDPVAGVYYKAFHAV